MTPNFSSTLDPAMDPGFLQEASVKARYVRFGPFCIDQHRQQVTRSGARIRLHGKVYQVLIGTDCAPAKTGGSGYARGAETSVVAC